MALKAVVFDVGETLVDETGMWERVADAAGVPRFTFMGILGGLAARGEHHRLVWSLLEVAPVPATFEPGDFYPDALACVAALRARGFRVGAVGNTPAFVEDVLREHFDFVGSSARWKTEKPSAGFFARVVQESAAVPAEIAYVGDRVDNDIVPALAAGLVGVHIRRGPWGYLHEPPPGTVRVRSLAELPEALARV